MAITRNGIMIFSFFFCFYLNQNLTFAVDGIYANQSFSGDQIIVSANGNFKLGFFQPGKSVSKNSSYYLGIWYNERLDGDTEVSVWIANREKPITVKESAVLKILDGNLVLLNEFQEPIWSTNIGTNSSHRSNDLVAVLRDDGNLVLRDVTNLDSNSSVWQSFDHPGNTWLPGAKISYNKRENTRRKLTSWKSAIDPAPGLYSLELDLNGSEILLKWNGSQQYFTTGTWNGRTFLLPSVNNYLYNFRYGDNENETYFTYFLYDPSSLPRMKMDPNGQMKQLIWDNKEWNLMASDPSQLCQLYAYCGAFGICDNTSLTNCGCPDGFDSHTIDDVEVPSQGCSRKTPLQCGNSSSSNGKRDRFKEISNIFLTEQSPNLTVVSIAECESTCLSSCFCTAYAYDNGRCSIWNGEIFNMQRLDTGRTIYIRLASSDHNKRKWIAILGGVLGAVAIFLGISVVALCRRRNKLIERKKAIRDLIVASPDREEQIAMEKESVMLRWGVLCIGFKRKLPPGPGKEEMSDIPIFSFEIIQVATDKFSEANKLGEGGFGPVFKGKLPNGQQIAVKRLSKSSGQGIEEFKNEVTLISKVQHRNLVKLLGCCTHGKERMLIYEYMPNKSLDLFIFGSATTGKPVLDWGLRKDIIEGIARGLLYLHRDSRLKIIHRDLKASNILLDEHMIPRISDFGMARIVMIDQSVANTNRVVGTFGYMAPEYALHGICSVKLDVFSFGVLLLEIVSGKRTSSFSDKANSMNLLGYVWQLWSEDKSLEDKALELLDLNLDNLCNTAEVYRCIHIALLCVQQNLNDRPTMSEVVFMLCNDTDLATPNQPAFCWTRFVDESSPESSLNLPREISVESRNEMSTSGVYGR